MGHIYKTVVIGGGISGLACAFRLRQLGIQAVVLESSTRPGGIVSTARRNGFVFEAGPQCPRFAASVWTLVRELNLESEFLAGDPNAKRYILRDGRLHLALFSAGGALMTRLVGPRSKYRLLSEVLRNSQPPVEEESLAEFGGQEISVETVVLATPAYAAASLLKQSAPKLAALLAVIEHAPMGVVSSAYERSQVRHALHGFGFMVPRREGLRVVCTFWNSSLFPSHAPKGSVLMTSFVRSDEGGLFAAPSEVFAQTVEAENAKILGITGVPTDRTVWRYPRALPQYNVGHPRRVKEIREAERELVGLCLAGNYLKGRSIGDCAETGFQAAEKLCGHMRN